MARLTINGQAIEAADDRTILEVVEQNSLDRIPTLCHNGQLEHFTSCFLCVVEVEGAKGLVPSCATKVRDGMTVKTRSEAVTASRKMNLELLMSNHYADCFPPCRHGCPANVDIQGYIALASRGEFREAQKLMRETNALPMVCGRVCARPCEAVCRRNFVEQPVDIKNIKRYIADLDLTSGDPWRPAVAPATGRKAAVVGSGPAGLACAYFLRQKGHDVTIFESMPEPGGMLRYGIPEYRLPKKDLKGEIDIILGLGIELRCGTEWGRDFTLDGLFKQGYGAVFLGIGCQTGSRMSVPGEDLSGVLQGVDFLRDVNLGRLPKLCGRVFVVGGGNTAIDAARTALRCGADEVSIVYRRTEAEMPANWEEIEDAKAEGISLRLLQTPTAYLGEQGTLRAVRLVRMQLGEPDSSGRRRPVEVPGSGTEEPVNTVIQALGQTVAMRETEGLALNRNGTIVADKKLFTTSRDGVFAAGDAVTGPDIIIAAVGQGRKAAFAMDLRLRGLDLKPENRLGFHIRNEDFGGPAKEEFDEEKRIPRNHLVKEPEQLRIRSFIEVERGLAPAALAKEAARCMECGCHDVFECKLKEYSGEYGIDKKRFIEPGRFNHRGDTYETGHRFLAMNTAKCINCGQCERICREVQKQSVFSYIRRGFDTLVVPRNLEKLGQTTCTACGACVASCPTGAIVERLPLGKPGPFENNRTLSTCGLCGDACTVVVETLHGRFMKITSKTKDTVLGENLCFRGRFGYEKFAGLSAPEPGGATCAEVRPLPGFNASKSLLLLSPVLTIEEIDYALSFAAARGIDVLCPGLESAGSPARLVAARRPLENKSLDRLTAGRKTVFFSGSFTDEFNAVLFRRLIRDDGAIDLVFDRNPRNKFFDLTVLAEAEFDRRLGASDPATVLAVVSLAGTPAPRIRKILEWAGPATAENVFVLHDRPNLGYLAGRLTLARQETTVGRLERGEFETILSVNETGHPVFSSSAKQKILICDRTQPASPGVTVFTMASLYEKDGSLIDQFGLRRPVVRAVRSPLPGLAGILA